MEAIAKFQQADTLRPNQAVTLMNWGNAFVGLERSLEAIDKFQQAAALQMEKR